MAMSARDRTKHFHYDSTSLGGPYVPFPRTHPGQDFYIALIQSTSRCVLKHKEPRHTPIGLHTQTKPNPRYFRQYRNPGQDASWKMARMVTLHKLICRGHDKTSLSEPNMSPPGRSKCFVQLFGDHLLFL